MHEEFIDQIALRINENPERLRICLAKLSEEQVWQRPNESSNSVANLILHLCGNLTQYVISSIGGEADHRERELEFSKRSGYSKSGLLVLFEETIQKATDILKKADETELLRTRYVQCYEMTGLACAIHACEHLSYHVGQIALITKLLVDEDLGFYEGEDLTKTTS